MLFLHLNGANCKMFLLENHTYKFHVLFLRLNGVIIHTLLCNQKIHRLLQLIDKLLNRYMEQGSF